MSFNPFREPAPVPEPPRAEEPEAHYEAYEQALPPSPTTEDIEQDRARLLEALGSDGLALAERLGLAFPAPAKALGTESGPAGGALVKDDQEPDPDDPDEDEEDEEEEGGEARAKGGAVKMLGSDPFKLRVRGVVWGGADLVGDTFERGVTDLGARRSFEGMPVYYDHALGGIKSQIGVVTHAEEDDDGIDFDIELDRSRKYAKTVARLAQAGALGSSTGAINHTVIRKRGVLKRWTVGELSLTPEPAEPRTHPALKSLDLTEENDTMGDEQPTQTAQPGADIAPLAAEIKSLGATVQAIRGDLDDLRAMPATKKAKTAEELGGRFGGGMQARAAEGAPVSPYHNFKSLFLPGGRAKFAELYPENFFGGYIKAVVDAKTSLDRSSSARKALSEVYGVDYDDPAAKTLSTQAGTSGAMLIAEQFIPQLMSVAGQDNALYGRVMVIPNTDGGEVVIPALNHSGTYTDGQSQFYGGVSISWGTDDAAPALTEPNFKQIRLKTNSLKARVRVKNSLLQRSAITIDAIVTNLLGGAIAWARDSAIIRGTGQGMPLGALYAPATIDSGGTTLDAATLEAMAGRTIPSRDSNYMWLIHTLRRPDVFALQQTSNTLVTFLPDLRGKPGNQVLGYPVTYTDKLPYTSGASNAADSVMLLDPSAIVVSEFQGIAISVSDQVRFEDDETVFRVILSLDAQPWLTSAVAIGSGASDTVSTYIRL